MLERIPKPIVNFFAGRIIDNLVTINSYKAIDRCYQKLVAEGGIPIVYYNHEGHPDGIAAAKVSGYLRDLTEQPRSRLYLPDWLRSNRRFGIQGLATIFAKSMVTGAQGEELKSSYDLLVGGGREKGLIPVPMTREKDRRKYNMTRVKIGAEALPLVRSLLAGYGMAFLPEGSIQGGCHPEGTGIEDIYGMQELDNNNLTQFYQLVVDKVAPKREGRPFYMPVGLFGSFRLMQRTEAENDVPKWTKRGKWSLFAAALGIPFGITKIEAQLLMPVTENDIVAELGPDWKELNENWENDPVRRRRVATFNRFMMGELLRGTPPAAWGFYGKTTEQGSVAPAIELSASS